eukprot:751344-Hanusia_phi.AAC.2
MDKRRMLFGDGAFNELVGSIDVLEEGFRREEITEAWVTCKIPSVSTSSCCSRRCCRLLPKEMSRGRW